MSTIPEKASRSAGARYPGNVMTTISQRGLNGEILIPWNAPRSALVEGLEILYYSFRYLVDFYTVDDSPRSPFVMVFGLMGDPGGEPPRPDGGELALARGVLRQEILEALEDDGYPFLLGRAVDKNTLTLVFGATRALDAGAAGGEGTAP
jgi:hypothetical protein